MTRFDSLVHVTRDGKWIGKSPCDASYQRLCVELDRAGVGRACLVGLAGVVDDDYLLERARASGGRLVPVSGFDPSRDADQASVAAAIGAVAGRGFTAVKLHPRLHGYDPLDPRCLSAIGAAAAHGLVVFLDTLFRQCAHATLHAADVVDRLSQSHPTARIVLLHGGGPALLEVAEVVRVRPALVLDVSFTLLHYAETSLDRDIRWLFAHLDQRVIVGSDMPEYTPEMAFAKADALSSGLAEDKRANIMHANLERLFPETLAR
jgi:predicted TIM-barrel fold metal-dependent hydrolase